jgi:dTDP-4-amino-4,6-dideoxygalactose transaminase
MQVVKKKFPSRIALGSKEIQSIKNVIQYYLKKNSDPGYQGYFEEKLCQKFSKMMHGGYADACASGTAAAFIAISALELKEGGEILITPDCDSGPVNAINFNKLKPKLIDSEKNNYNISAKEFEKRISKNTKAAIIVHAAGDASQISKIVHLAKNKGIKIIEDCSQAPFAKCSFCAVRCHECKNKYLGEFGDISFFSTMYSKNISSCGSGGIVFTKKKLMYHKILSYADRGKKVWRKDINLKDPSKALFPALNLNSNEFSSAITNASLNRVFKTNYLRKNFIRHLKKFLEKSMTCSILFKNINTLAPFYVPIKVELKRIRISKKNFAKEIRNEGVPLLDHYGCIINEWPWLKKVMKNSFKTKNAISFRNCTFNLFLNENYKKIHAQKIVNSILKIEKKYLK